MGSYSPSMVALSEPLNQTSGVPAWCLGMSESIGCWQRSELFRPAQGFLTGHLLSRHFCSPVGMGENMSPPGIVTLGCPYETDAGGSEIQGKPGLWNAHLRNKIRAGEMAQWVECWDHSEFKPSSQRSTEAPSCNPALGRRPPEISRVLRPASLAYLASSRPARDGVSRNKMLTHL